MNKVKHLIYNFLYHIFLYYIFLKRNLLKFKHKTFNFNVSFVNNKMKYIYCDLYTRMFKLTSEFYVKYKSIRKSIFNNSI